ncbi:unnamed protein product [Clonostachys rhizophaga]|uniref:Enoyl reductase (ER) domain-containing protein n=1 Tax=Clonostachys rhizophaga TaxID=160324 RepID=A0A9N9V5Z5_9HYPO|nr:unnamed protein product [Clonostachys rhizophaga]
MAQEIPKTVKQWSVSDFTGFDALKFSEEPIPELGDSQVLVKFHAASLNYRDLIIPKGLYPFKMEKGIIPGSDGAGTVVAVGNHVDRFKAGDNVITLFNQGHLGGSLDLQSAGTGLGGAVDGVLRTYGAFDQNGLVAMPSNLSFSEASTLPCAGVTAWNALYGLSDKKLLPGQWVLTQGTGGVSIFGVQLAKAAGAKVIATTSSAEKGKLLEKLGADHIINYKETPNWGEKAKEITGGRGVDHVIEVAGPKSIAQSLIASKLDGVITIIGFVGGVKGEQEPGFLEALNKLVTIRGILVGSRVQLEELAAAVSANPDKLRPVIDPKKFKLEELKEAYEYQWSAQHQAKVIINIA